MKQMEERTDPKTGFIQKKLLPYYFRKINVLRNQEQEEMMAKLASLQVFPYKTQQGTSYGCLADLNCSWYYISKQQDENRISTESYKILDIQTMGEDNFTELKKYFDGGNNLYLRAFDQRYVIDDLVKRMSQNTELSEEWWNCAKSAYALWDERNPGERYKKATEHICIKEILMSDDYFKKKYQKLFFKYSSFRDLRESSGYKRYMDGISESKRETAESFLKYLGIPTRLIDGKGLYSSIKNELEDFYSDIESRMRFPVCDYNISDFECAFLSEYILFHVLIDIEHYVFVPRFIEKHKRGIGILNAKNQYIPLECDLFHFDPEESYGDLNGLLVNPKYTDAQLQYITNNVHELDRIEVFSKYHFCGVSVTKQDFYQWVWSLRQDLPLARNILDSIDYYDETHAAFAFDVLRFARENGHSTRKSIEITGSAETIWTYGKTLNELAASEDWDMTLRIGSHSGLLDTKDIFELITTKLSKQNYDAEHFHKICNSMFWKHIYLVKDTVTEEREGFHEHGPEYVLIKDDVLRCSNEYGLLVKQGNENEYVSAIAQYIYDKYKVEVQDLYTDWKDEYQKLKKTIRDFINQSQRGVDIESIRVQMLDMDDVPTWGEERALWKRLVRQEQELLNDEHKFFSFGKDYLDSKYHGKCQICGAQTPRGSENDYFYTYRIAKKKDSQLADLESNLFCLCPSCHGNLQYSFLTRDLTDIKRKAEEYIGIYKDILENGIDDEEDSGISILADYDGEMEGFRTPIICNVVVNGEKHKMAFSWDHFIRIAFMLHETDEV